MSKLFVQLTIFFAILGLFDALHTDAKHSPPSDYCPGIDTNQALTPEGKLVVNNVEITGGLVPCSRKCDDPLTEEDESADCTFCHFFYLLKIIVNWILFKAAPLIGLLLLVFGGFMLLASRGDPGQSQFGKRLIVWSLTGYAVMLIGWAIINSVFAGIGIQQWTGLTGENGNMEFASSCADNMCTIFQDTDKTEGSAWTVDEWKNFVVVMEHSGWAEPKSASIASNTVDSLALETSIDTEGQTIGGISYKIGGWWQLKCP